MGLWIVLHCIISYHFISYRPPFLRFKLGNRIFDFRKITANKLYLVKVPSNLDTTDETGCGSKSERKTGRRNRRNRIKLIKLNARERLEGGS